MSRKSVLIVALFAVPLKSQAMLPPTSSAQIGLSSLPRGLGSGSSDGLGVAALFRYSERSNDAGERAENMRSTLVLDYGLTQRLTAVATLPYVRNTARSNGVTTSASGLGDLGLLAKYALYQERALLSREIFLIAGVELPTGSHSAKDSAGQRLPLTFQPGSDSLDFLAGAAAVWSLWEIAFYGDAVYKRNGRETYSFGDNVGANLGVNIPLRFAPKFSASAELTAAISGRDHSRVLGGVVPNTGGETLSVSPSLQWRPRPDLSLAAGVEIPVYQRLTGDQLRSGVNPIASVSMRFWGAR